MKAVLLFAVAAAALAGHALVADANAHPDEVLFDFMTWMKLFEKEYHSAEEMGMRLGIFAHNRKFVHHHNAHSDASFQLGLMNEHADMTNDEFRMHRNGFHPKAAATRNARYTHRPLLGQDLPDEVDWRQKNVVTDVKNQGQCGSCWSFSAAEAIESAHALKTGEVVVLSEQELVDCVAGGEDDCGHGGEMTQAFEYAMKKGLVPETDYPYEAKSGEGCRVDKTATAVTIAGYANVTEGDEHALQSAVANFPTVSIAIDASSMWFQFYMGGVYDHEECSSTELDHGVLLVGYGVEDGKDYWLVRNSWGATWGDKGYIKIRRNAGNMCGVATDASYPLVD